MPAQHWLQQRMEELKKTGKFIAQNRLLLSGEFNCIYV
jgi:hypothetical protein